MKQGIICISTMCSGRNDVTCVWLVLSHYAAICLQGFKTQDRGVYFETPVVISLFDLK